MTSFKRGERVRGSTNVVGEVVGFHQWGYLVRRDDGSLWIYLREFTRAEAA